MHIQIVSYLRETPMNNGKPGTSVMRGQTESKFGKANNGGKKGNQNRKQNRKLIWETKWRAGPSEADTEPLAATYLTQAVSPQP